MPRDEPIGFADLDKLPTPPRYHVIVVAADGRVVHAERLSADDDREALLRASALVEGGAVELWDGLRFIEHFDATSPAPESDPTRG